MLIVKTGEPDSTVLGNQLECMAQAGVLLASTELPGSDPVHGNALDCWPAGPETIALCVLIEVRSSEEATAWSHGFVVTGSSDAATVVDIRHVRHPFEPSKVTLH
ncbi:hypothetical protein [Hydrogenophaga sp. 5NK40-0174]|uniref:hypothetical protein n=1 Tax=Hydrogenophaga sp. 5NK40-0174 TaxID=3127649 RepID=UPI0033413940